jgi:hypothetical protein
VAKKSVPSSASRSSKARKGSTPVSRRSHPRSKASKRSAASDSSAKQEIASREVIAILATQLEILATLRAPTTTTKNKPGTFIRQAARLIESIPQYLAVPFEQLTTDEMRAYIQSQSERRAEEDAHWERNMPPLLTYKEAASAPWCRFKTWKRLLNFMKRYEYPPRYYPHINLAGYQVAINKEQTEKRDSERLRKRTARKKPTPKAKSLADSQAKLGDKRG